MVWGHEIAGRRRTTRSCTGFHETPPSGPPPAPPDLPGQRLHLGVDASAGARQAVVLGGLLQNDLRRDLATRVRKEVLERAFGYLRRDGLAKEGRERRHAEQSPLELADVLLETGGDEAQDVVGNLDAIAMGLQLQDGDPRLKVGRL